MSALIESVEDRGAEQVTVSQIIARARVSRKTFYDLFRDREDCFLAAFEGSSRHRVVNLAGNRAQART
jgi:AcrR family transcriptional regulator